MRGKVLNFSVADFPFGITPAYAGKRLISSISAPPQWDHPRLCGEKAVDRDVCAGSEGSPPPMRGKGVQIVRGFCVSGITPAYAGKRRKNRDGYNGKKDHPRLCGEKDFERPPFSNS